MKREAWIDACRFFAIFVVMVTHFLATFLPDSLLLWEQGPSRWLLGGLTGQFSVAFFFVLLGYFASFPRRFSLAGYGRYCAQRYAQFSFFIFVTCVFYLAGSYLSAWCFHTPDEAVFRVLSDGPRYNVIYLLHDAFLFENHYNDTLWCMQQLFLASLLCRALGSLPDRWTARGKLAFALGLILLLMLLDARYCVWICIAVLGYLLHFALERLRARPLGTGPLLLLALLALLCIKAPLDEGLPLFLAEGLGAFLLILLQFQLPAVQRRLSADPFPRLGRISMGLFVVHTPLYSLLGSTVYPLLLRPLPQAAALPLCFLLALALSILCAVLLHRAYAALERFMNRERAAV